MLVGKTVLVLIAGGKLTSAEVIAVDAKGVDLKLAEDGRSVRAEKPVGPKDANGDYRRWASLEFENEVLEVKQYLQDLYSAHDDLASF